MKTLVVMRHAKSDWDAGAQSDHERPLNDRGRTEAPIVARRLAAAGHTPQLVLSSDSRRTTETHELAAPAWPGAACRFTPSLYLAGVEAVRALAPSVPDEVGTLLVLGHNPGWEEMVEALTGDEHPLKTAYAAVLRSDADSWQDALAPGATMSFVAMITP